MLHAGSWVQIKNFNVIKNKAEALFFDVWIMEYKCKGNLVKSYFGLLWIKSLVKHCFWKKTQINLVSAIL